MTKQEAHDILAQAFDLVCSLTTTRIDGLTDRGAYHLGRATGSISAARTVLAYELEHERTTKPNVRDF